MLNNDLWHRLCDDSDPPPQAEVKWLHGEDGKGTSRTQGVIDPARAVRQNLVKTASGDEVDTGIQRGS